MRKWGVLIIAFIICASLLRALAIDIFKVPSSSMEPALLPGDIIVISKINYGPRIIKLIKFIKLGKIDFYRLPGMSTIRKGDILVFNSHRINYYNEAVFNNYSDISVKRCFTTPGHYTKINNENFKTDTSVALSNRFSIFPRYFRNIWSIDHYGPLYIPAQDDIVRLTNVNIQIYKHIILTEDPNIQFNDSIVKSNGKTILDYKFRQNYYFVLGDNFYNSYDSRYWGFVSDKDIIGKVVMVLFSIDSTKEGLRKIRFNRILKFSFN